MSTRQRAEDPNHPRWRSIAENPFDFVVVIGRDFKYRYVNHTAPGVRAEDLIGKATPFDFVDPSQHERMRAALEEAFREGCATSYEVYVPQLDSWFSSIVGPIEVDGEVEELSILTRDITEAKRAVVALERSEARLRLALEGADVGLFDVELQSGEVYYSPSFFRLLGYAEGDAELPQEINEFERRLHPEDRAQGLAALRLATEASSPFDHEYRLQTRSGEYRWFHGRGRVFESSEGQRRFAGILTDITERRQLAQERARLEAQLWQAQKMETVGTLAGGMAHDVNNALTPVVGFAELALARIAEDHPARAHIAAVLEAAGTARDLVRQVLLFSRRADEALDTIELGATVRDSLRLVQSSLPARVSLRLEPSKRALDVLANATHIQQVVTNLCTNACQAVLGCGGGTIRVALHERELGAPTVMTAGALSPGRYACMTVSDNGPGIDPESLPRILEPFYTTKPVGEGTGLGLAVVQGIVLRHGGAVDVRSVPGQGATFDVYLPLADALPQSAASSASVASERPAGKRAIRVLLVEDEPTVARVEQQMLRTLGHEVSLARDGDEALALLERAGDEFDLVITDHNMPGITGTDLGTRLRERLLPLPTLLVTGMPDPTVVDAARSHGLAGVLRKPFTMAELGAAIEQALKPD